MPSNPFVPLELVGRVDELARICAILLQDGDFLLVGTPGNGRRTLLREATRKVGARMLEVDCLRATSAHRFLRLLADSLTDSFVAAQEIAWIQKWSLDQPLTVELTPANRARLVWSSLSGKEWTLFESLLALPQQLAEWLECQVVLVLQNFPHIRSWDRQGKWETYLRQEIQRQSQVSYVLVTPVTEPWVHDSNLPVIELPPLEAATLGAWLVRSMRAEGLVFSEEEGALDLFLSYVQGNMGDAIALARCVWMDMRVFGRGGTLIQAHHVHRSLLALLEDLSVTFEALILLLPPSQVRVLESLALDPTDSPQSRDYIKRHQLSRGGGLQGALTSLEQKGLIYGPRYGYRIALPLLNLWLQQRLK